MHTKIPKKKRQRRRAGPPPASPLLSPNDLMERWRCSRSTVDLIARRAGLTRVCLGDQRGLVRFKLEEVIAFEEKRSVKTGGQ